MVTGGAGFVGGHVTRALLGAGARVAVLDDLSSGSPRTLTRLLELGLREDDVFVENICTEAAVSAVRRWSPEVLCHLAAQPRVLDSIRAPVRDARANVLGTVTMLETAAQAGRCRLVLASSGGAVYGEQVGASAPTGEQRRLEPISPYGLSKATGEAYARMYGALTGLPVTVLRLGNVYGRHIDGRPGPGVLTSFARSVVDGDPPQVIGDGRQTRDFVHVRDAADAFRLAASAATGAVFNIGSGVETTVLSALRVVCEALSTSCAPRHVAAVPGEVRRVCLDVSAARSGLGWLPTVELAGGVRDLVESLVAAGVDRSAVQTATG